MGLNITFLPMQVDVLGFLNAPSSAQKMNWRMKLLKPGDPRSNENFEIRRRQFQAEILANSTPPTRFDHGLVQNPPIVA